MSTGANVVFSIILLIVIGFAVSLFVSEPWRNTVFEFFGIADKRPSGNAQQEPSIVGAGNACGEGTNAVCEEGLDCVKRSGQTRGMCSGGERLHWCSEDNDCKEGLRCYNGICNDGSEGSMCNLEKGYRCKEGHTCFQNTCVLSCEVDPRDENAEDPCRSGQRCIRNRCVDHDGEPSPVRGECSIQSHCAEGLKCYEGFCTDKLPLASPCTSGTQCASNTCGVHKHCNDFDACKADPDCSISACAVSRHQKHCIPQSAIGVIKYANAPNTNGNKNKPKEKATEFIDLSCPEGQVRSMITKECVDKPTTVQCPEGTGLVPDPTGTTCVFPS